MAYSVPDLAYPFDALEPHIDARTMEIHHDKHHAAYVTNLNAALEGTESMDQPIEAAASRTSSHPRGQAHRRPEQRRRPRESHALLGDHGPGGGGEPSGDLAAAIADAFGSLDDLKAQVNDAGVKRFGSGWSWLVWDGDGLVGHLHAEPGLARDGREDAAPRRRRLGARLLPQLPEPAARLPRGLVERRRLERRGAKLDAAARSAECRRQRRPHRKGAPGRRPPPTAARHVRSNPATLGVRIPGVNAAVAVRIDLPLRGRVASIPSWPQTRGLTPS